MVKSPKTPPARTFLLKTREVKSLDAELKMHPFQNTPRREIIAGHDRLCPEHIPFKTPVRYRSTSWRSSPLFSSQPTQDTLRTMRTSLQNTAIGKSQHICLRIQEQSDGTVSFDVWNPFTKRK